MQYLLCLYINKKRQVGFFDKIVPNSCLGDDEYSMKGCRAVLVLYKRNVSYRYKTTEW